MNARTTFAAVTSLLLLPLGCSTTQNDGYSVRFSDGTSTTVLDSKLKQYEKLSKEYPKRADIHYDMAGLHYQKMDYREAARDLENAITLEPNEPKYHYHLGRVYLSMRELDRAETCFRRANELMPAGRYTGAHGALGYVLCQKGRWKEALAEYETCAKIDPGDANSFYYIGCIRDVLRDREGAVSNLKQYLLLGGTEYRRKAIEILAAYGEEPPALAEGAPAAKEGAGETGLDPVAPGTWNAGG
jgi:tetratricopeptide (TPR) repeat protein